MNKLLYEIDLTPTFNFFLKQLLFIYFFTVLGLHCCEDFASVVMSGGCSLLPGTDFSLWRLLLLRTTDSRAFGLQQLQLPAVEHRLDSCGSRA